MLFLARPGEARAWEATLTETAATARSEQFVVLANAALDRAYRLAGLILSDATEAEDAVGDALERAWASFATLRDRDGFAAWFDRILVNACRDRLRRRRIVRFVPLDTDHDRPSSTDPFRRVIDQDELLRAMDLLDDDERVVIALHFWADLTLTDVAARTGWPVGTVKSRLHRALQRMRPSTIGSSDEVAG